MNHAQQKQGAVPERSTSAPVILVIEDNPANMKLTTLQLRHAGYQGQRES